MYFDIFIPTPPHNSSHIHYTTFPPCPNFMSYALHLLGLLTLHFHRHSCSLAKGDDIKIWDICKGQKIKSPFNFFLSTAIFLIETSVSELLFLVNNYSAELHRYWGTKMTDPENSPNIHVLRAGENNMMSVSPILEVALRFSEGSLGMHQYLTPTLVSSQGGLVSKRRRKCFLPLRSREPAPDLQGLSTALLMPALVQATQESKSGGWLQPGV